MVRSLKKFYKSIIKHIHRVGINTWLLLIVILMLFGDWSHIYYPHILGLNWHMDKIAPFIYYSSAVATMILIGIVILWVIGKIGSDSK